MSYGVRFTNSNNTVTLDSEFARLTVFGKGAWSGTNSISIAFPKIIDTEEPPLIFVRPDQSNTFCFCLVIGSANSWTGFSFRTNGNFSSGKWFASAFKSQPTASYGFRLWDGSGKMLFDSGNPCAQFTRTISSWSYLGSSQTSQGVYLYSWAANAPLTSGDYMLLNNIAMDMAGVVSRQGNMYALWDYGNNRVVMQAVGVDLPSAFYMPVVFAKSIQ